MSKTNQLEMTQAEIKYLSLRLEYLTDLEKALKEQIGTPDYSDHPYQPHDEE